MFDWLEYFDLARNLARQDNEASQRSAVSRAYYAIFCSARNRLRWEGESIPRTGEAHRIVWDQFEKNAEKMRRKIAQDGKRLKHKRAKVDYDDEVMNLGYLVQDAMKTADNLILRLRSL